MPGNWRTAEAMASAFSCVAERLVPSGVRTVICNCDSSSLGRKSLPTAPNSGTVLARTPRHSRTMTQRWRIDHLSSQVYPASIGLKIPPSLEELLATCPAAVSPVATGRASEDSPWWACSCLGGLIQREESIGV